MKFTFSWLKEHLDTTATVDEISEKLTALGLEVDCIVNPAEDLQDFIIAHIVSAEPHPDADKLKICQVSTGSETLRYERRPCSLRSKNSCQRHDSQKYNNPRCGKQRHDVLC